MSEDDPLERYLEAIECTHWKTLAQWEKEHTVRVMRRLADEVRTQRGAIRELRAQVAELDTQRIADYEDTKLGRELREKESRGIA